MRRVSTPVCCSSSVMTGPSVWPSNGFPCSALVCSTNWPPLGLVAGVAIDTLQPNSYGARAFPLPMHSTSGACSANFGAALPVILEGYPMSRSEEGGEAHLECLVAVDLAADVADHPAEADAQELHGASRPLELVGMAVAADHDRGALGHPPIALPQRHTAALCKIDQLFQCAMAEPRIGRVRDRLRLHRRVDHHPFEIPGRQPAGLVRYRQALLEQGDQLFLAQPPPPMR